MSCVGPTLGVSRCIVCERQRTVATVNAPCCDEVATLKREHPCIAQWATVAYRVSEVKELVNFVCARALT